MTRRHSIVEFIVTPGRSRATLAESIRNLRASSASFQASWREQRLQEAELTSQNAVRLIDYIASEVLRHRDVNSTNGLADPSSHLRTALGSLVGEILPDASTADQEWFTALAPEAGALPGQSLRKPLSLGVALNKLKHRDPVAIKFALATSGEHELFILTRAGMGQPASLSRIDVAALCDAAEGCSRVV